MKNYKDCITPELGTSLRKWMRTLLHQNAVTKEEKVKNWMNSVNHHRGRHDNCPTHSKRSQVLIHNDETADRGTAFLKETSWILESCDSDLSTQVNESFNRGKLKYANKDIKWGFTWKARMCCAVLDRNLPMWKLKLYETIGLPRLHPSVIEKLENMECERLRKKYAKVIYGELICHKRKQEEKRRANAARIPAGTEIAYLGNPYDAE
jgi:hypothetical protein